LTYDQVQHWMINARSRFWRPMLQEQQRLLAAAAAAGGAVGDDDAVQEEGDDVGAGPSKAHGSSSPSSASHPPAGGLSVAAAQATALSDVDWRAGLRTLAMPHAAVAAASRRCVLSLGWRRRSSFVLIVIVVAGRRIVVAQPATCGSIVHPRSCGNG
jgi:hypothetical protein